MNWRFGFLIGFLTAQIMIMFTHNDSGGPEYSDNGMIIQILLLMFAVHCVIHIYINREKH